MPSNTPDFHLEDITPELRKALVELGAVIPTTPEEVELAERQMDEELTPDETNAAYAKLQQQLKGKAGKPFLHVPLADSSEDTEGFARAARKGADLDPGTLAQIERDLAKDKQHRRD